LTQIVLFPVRDSQKANASLLAVFTFLLIVKSRLLKPRLSAKSAISLVMKFAVILDTSIVLGKVKVKR
jgi:hypothetical protein